ncbi:hypothetical protein GOP47_0027406 [Adiantum capillus-veneris]|nr:hypothetical protein GOP47_0027406 [Adiantum capillus-veneris]
MGNVKLRRTFGKIVKDFDSYTLSETLTLARRSFESNFSPDPVPFFHDSFAPSKLQGAAVELQRRQSTASSSIIEFLRLERSG